MKPTEAKDNRIIGLLTLYDMQTDFFPSVLDGVSDTSALARLDTKANHMAWLAGSIVQQRYELATALTEKEYKQSAEALFSNNQGIKDNAKYPLLNQYITDWKTISPILREAMLFADTNKLDSDMKIPEMKITHFEMLSFALYREANHIGQLALWRRLLGYEPMKYM